MCCVLCVGRLLETRGRLYELLSHCIPPDVIMKVFCLTVENCMQIEYKCICSYSLRETLWK